MPHLPEFPLLARAPVGARRGDRERMDCIERKIAADVAQLAGVDVVALDLRERGGVELPAERALKIGELHHRQRSVGAAEKVAGDARKRDAFGWSSLLDELPDLAQLAENLLILLLDGPDCERERDRQRAQSDNDDASRQRPYWGAVQVSLDDPLLHARNLLPEFVTNVAQLSLSQSESFLHSLQCPFLPHPRIDRHETTVRTIRPLISHFRIVSLPSRLWTHHVIGPARTRLDA